MSRGPITRAEMAHVGGSGNGSHIGPAPWKNEGWSLHLSLWPYWALGSPEPKQTLVKPLLPGPQVNSLSGSPVAHPFLADFLSQALLDEVLPN